MQKTMNIDEIIKIILTGKKTKESTEIKEKIIKIEKEKIKDGQQITLIPQYDELVEDIQDIYTAITKGNTIMQMSNTQLQNLVQLKEHERGILIRKIEYLIMELRREEERKKSWQQIANKQEIIIKEEKQKMQKIINIVKIIGYVISVILPLLDGVKGVTSKVTEIYKNGSN